MATIWARRRRKRSKNKEVEYEEGKKEEEDENKKFFDQVKDGLEKFKKNIWIDMQEKISSILRGSTVTSFKIDEFLKVFDAIVKVILIFFFLFFLL